MKKIHIIGIVVIAVAIGVIFTSLQSSASYSDFSEAFNNPETEYHVVGKLNKTIPVQYDPKLNANECSFMMVDNKGIEKRVVLHNYTSFTNQVMHTLLGYVQTLLLFVKHNKL